MPKIKSSQYAESVYKANKDDYKKVISEMKKLIKKGAVYFLDHKHGDNGEKDAEFIRIDF